MLVSFRPTFFNLQVLACNFEDSVFRHIVLTIVVRQKVNLTRPLYASRSSLISKIPNFWPLVFEHAPPDIDEFIQPSDFVVLSSSLYNLSVSHDVVLCDSPDDPGCNLQGTKLSSPNGHEKLEGDPRSFLMTFSFAENSYFGATHITKKFWYHHSKYGWGGFVSEPVRIKWKEGKDLTEGLLDLICDAWESAQPSSQDSDEQDSEPSDPETTAKESLLQQKLENAYMSERSFFAWFGYVGRHLRHREANRRSSASSSSPWNQMNENADGVGTKAFLEGFPRGDELAVAIAEDLWPGAIKYYSMFSSYSSCTLLSIPIDVSYDSRRT